MVSKPNFQVGEDDMKFFFHSFEKKKWVADGPSSRVKCRKTSFEGEGFGKIP